MIPVGISKMLVAISRMEISVLMARKDSPDSLRKRMKNGSKNRRFFRNP